MPDTPNTPADSGDLKRLADIVSNAYMMRTDLFKRLVDPRRDIDDECGYPKTVQVQVYQDLYDRLAVAARVVQVLPKESWQVQPLVYEDQDSEVVTPFEAAWDELGKSLRGGRSWYKDEEGSPVWEYLYRADELSGIGQYGVILLGLDDGLDLMQPVKGIEEYHTVPSWATGYDDRDKYPETRPKGVTANCAATYGRMGPYRMVVNKPAPAPNGSKSNGLAGASPMEKTNGNGKAGAKDNGKAKGTSRKLLYLRVFPEYLAQITQFESNPASPRFGQPVMYSITFNDPREQHSGIGLPLATRNVHWTRVIHLADNLSSSEVFGVPRMRPVLNRLFDLQKLYGGSAEMYWRGAFPGISLETHPQLGGDVEIDKTAMRDMMEQYMNGLQRYLTLMGMSAKTLSPQVVDPTPQINTQIEAICIHLGIPKRVFMGSERGELASSQDDASWNDRLRQRQHGYITPRIIVPFIDRLITIGVLPEPEAKVKKSNLAKQFKSPITGGEAPDPDAVPGKPANGKPFPTSKGNGKPAPSGAKGKFPFSANTTLNALNADYPPDDEDVDEDEDIDEDIDEDVDEDEDISDGTDVPEGDVGIEEAEAERAGYSVEWPDLTSQGDAEKADIATKRTSALAAYISGGVEAIITPLDYLVSFMEMDEEEAAAILTNAEEHALQTEQEDVAKQQQMIDEGLAPDPTKQVELDTAKAEAETQAIKSGKMPFGQPPGGGFPPKGKSAPSGKKPPPFARK